MYNKIRRILAIIGVIILVGMYAATFFCAMSGTGSSGDMFKASIFCTVIIPAFIYGYSLICKAVGSRAQKNAEEYEKYLESLEEESGKNQSSK